MSGKDADIISAFSSGKKIVSPQNVIDVAERLGSFECTVLKTNAGWKRFWRSEINLR